MLACSAVADCLAEATIVGRHSVAIEGIAVGFERSIAATAVLDSTQAAVAIDSADSELFAAAISSPEPGHAEADLAVSGPAVAVSAADSVAVRKHSKRSAKIAAEIEVEIAGRHCCSVAAATLVRSIAIAAGSNCAAVGSDSSAPAADSAKPGATVAGQTIVADWHGVHCCATAAVEHEHLALEQRHSLAE